MLNISTIKNAPDMRRLKTQRLKIIIWIKQNLLLKLSKRIVIT